MKLNLKNLFCSNLILIPFFRNILSILESSRKTNEYKCYQLIYELAHKHYVDKIFHNNRKK